MAIEQKLGCLEEREMRMELLTLNSDQLLAGDDLEEARWLLLSL